MLKEEVQRKYGLKVDPDVMMLSSIGRIDPSQKGFDILLGIIPRLEGKAQMVISGTGDPVLERTLLDLSRQYPSFFHYTHARNENLTRLLLGASNAVVMGSRYEPCGQTQFMGWRYGALLIARDTGGLHDTGIDLNDNPRSGNAFLFQEHTSDAFDGAITRASDMYSQHQGVWQKASIRAMGLRFYWEDVAKKYLELYESLLENPTE